MPSAARSRPSQQPCTAVIGDMIASRTLGSGKRKLVQKRFAAFVQSLNENPRYSRALLSKFAVTLGDEFQGVFRDAAAIPDLIWEMADVSGLPVFRLGIGYGVIETEIPEYAINLDGPALHRARTAIDLAKEKELLGGVFCGFGEEIDEAANGVARLLWFHREKRTAAQLRVLRLLRQGLSQVEIARETQSTPQNVSQHQEAAGWEAFRAGEQALRAILKLGAPRPPK